MPKRALDLRRGPPCVSYDPIPFPPPQSYAPATRFSLIPSGLENPGPTVVPVIVYPAATPDPTMTAVVKTRSAAANVEVNGGAILFSWTHFFDCNLVHCLGTNRLLIEGRAWRRRSRFNP